MAIAGAEDCGWLRGIDLKGDSRRRLDLNSEAECEGMDQGVVRK
jgi:hypothetical protein